MEEISPVIISEKTRPVSVPERNSIRQEIIVYISDFDVYVSA
jgi:hypothetical protein